MDNTENPIVSFEFLYRRKYDQVDASEFFSRKSTLIEAIDDFLTQRRDMYDIDEEVKITYQDGTDEFVFIDVRQDWDMSWYIVVNGRGISGNGWSWEIKKELKND